MLYLFLLCVERLSTLFSVDVQPKLIHGIKVSLGCMPITDLFFIDDSLIFCRAQTQQWHQIHT